VGYNEQNRLWINDGFGNFTANDIADDIFLSWAVISDDFNNDGNLDIYIATQ
jgi:hypothetical protein